ncbi:hypothetical protein LINPERHAP1_LOCUS20209 [Linum perenne]
MDGSLWFDLVRDSVVRLLRGHRLRFLE